ncbi:myoD family inhibitor [Fukomys damarensis]|uniref:myoD family inhibitor n=1 Tax=Fukomys damarensis TaxID=885580 RepID=UPI0005402327|nr:myoD family inhibitor [Fukomys damarensis]
MEGPDPSQTPFIRTSLPTTSSRPPTAVPWTGPCLLQETHGWGTHLPGPVPALPDFLKPTFPQRSHWGGHKDLVTHVRSPNKALKSKELRLRVPFTHKLTRTPLRAAEDQDVDLPAPYTQTHSALLLSGPQVGERPAHTPEAASQEGSLEEAAPPTPQGSSPGAPQALDSTDHDVPTEAVTCQPQGNPLGCTPLLPNGSSHPSELSSTRRAGNGALGGPKAHRKLQSHPSLASQGSKKSKGSTKSASSQIPLQAQEDCCVHCVLSCLFCEFLTLCNLVLDCATCGSCGSDDACLCCCCCCCGAGGGSECTDCDLPCDLDCGILDACCGSADCLEICMECCGLCFSS